jgi:hypothetical protein
MREWFATYGPNFMWPAMLIVGVLCMALIWSVASAMYEQLSGILAGAAFMILGLGLVLYCAYYLLSHSPVTHWAIFLNGVGIMAGIGALGAGSLGLRNAGDF